MKGHFQHLHAARRWSAVVTAVATTLLTSLQHVGWTLPQLVRNGKHDARALFTWSHVMVPWTIGRSIEPHNNHICSQAPQSAELFPSCFCFSVCLISLSKSLMSFNSFSPISSHTGSMAITWTSSIKWN